MYRVVIKTLKNTPGRLHRQRGWREEGETSFQRECNPRPSAQETCPKNGCHVNHVARLSPSLVPQPTDSCQFDLARRQILVEGVP